MDRHIKQNLTGQSHSEWDMPSKPFLTIGEVANLLQVSNRTVYNLIYKGTLRACKITYHITLITKEDFFLMIKETTYCKRNTSIFAKQIKKNKEKMKADIQNTDKVSSFQQEGKKKEQAVQEEPTKTVKTAAEEKPAKEKKTEAKAEVKSEQQAEQKAEAKQERKPREPQMITANGEKVSHGHAFQSTTNPADWYFTAKMDGVQLKPQKMDAADLAAYQKKEMTVPQLMEKYYPTKLMPKVSEEAFQMPKQLSGPDGAITIDKFNVYKEKDEQRPDYGKYKFYVQMGDTKMSAVASREDLNAYFDRVVSPTQLVEKNFGERLHLQSAYEKYQLPEGVDPKGVRVAKDHSDNKWKVSMDLGDKGKTSKHELSFDDGYSLFKAKTATREQIAAKYLNTEITGMLSAVTNKLEKSASMKM